MRRLVFHAGRLTACSFLLFLCLGAALATSLQANPSLKSPDQKVIMSNHAKGTFDVKLSPQKPDNKDAEAANLGRMSADKQYHGDLEGIGKGEMLAANTEVKGSAGYVAMERVTGTLQGRSGSFVLQHSGTMTRGKPELTITVVPDSGTGQLTGLAGKMNIIVTDGKHSYEFDYTLPEKP